MRGDLRGFFDDSETFFRICKKERGRKVRLFGFFLGLLAAIDNLVPLVGEHSFHLPMTAMVGVDGGLGAVGHLASGEAEHDHGTVFKIVFIQVEVAAVHDNEHIGKEGVEIAHQLL